MAVFPVYLDALLFVNRAHANIELNSLIGMNTTLQGGPYTAGATTLTVASTSGETRTPSSSAPIDAWILDGLNSEVVSVTGISGMTLTLAAGTLATHATGANLSTGGSGGALADDIHQASREVDNICQQGPDGVGEYDGATITDRSLYAISRTETYIAPYGGASFNVDNALSITPYHFPVRGATSLSVQVGAQTTATITLQYLVLPNGARTLTVPWAQTVGTPPNAPSYFTQPFSRIAETYITLTYTAGPINGTTLTAVPSDIQAATMLLTQDRLATRKNPFGAAMVRRGDENYSFELRGDTAGKSMLFKDAMQRLRPYIRVY